jgi:hypothetical protein
VQQWSEVACIVANRLVVLRFGRCSKIDLIAPKKPRTLGAYCCAFIEYEDEESANKVGGL